MSSAENIKLHQHCGKSDMKEVRLADYDRCTGCAVCMAVCPVHAVQMKEDTINGFFYPIISSEQCVKCHKCEEVCPSLHQYEKNTHYAKVFAANNKDMEARYKSASGALFPALAEGVLENGGAVAGVVFSDISTCKHVVATNLNELEPMRGTKYFQSDMTGIYADIYEQVAKEGKEVLFCGTPCQVRAVRNFAKEKQIEEKIITVDLLCRGVPSPYVYQKNIECLEKRYGKKVLHIQMKEKTRGWNNVGGMISFEDGSREYERENSSAFGRSFLKTNLAIRESCFHCPYKTIHRESDITIGDFWGLRNNHLLEDNKGTSFVLLNTEKGELLFEQIKHRLDYLQSTMWRVYKGNTAAFHQIQCEKEKRDVFYALLHENVDLSEAIDRVSFGKRQSMRVLVLGGTGEISSYMVKKLLDSKEEVTVFNRGNRKQHMDERAENVQVDVNDEIQLRRAVVGKFFDKVIDFTTYEKSELERKVNILKDCCGCYVFISSAAVYCKEDGKREYVEEDDAYNIAWEYGYKKRECEETLKKICNKTGLKYLIIRPGCTYGEKFIPFSPLNGYWLGGVIVQLIENEEPLIAFNDNEDTIQVMHASDFAENVYRLINNGNSVNNVFNVTGEEHISLNDVLRIMSDYLNKVPNVIPCSRKVITEYKELELVDYTGKISNMKLKNYIEISVDKKLRECIPAMIENNKKEDQSHLEWYIKKYRSIFGNQ